MTCNKGKEGKCVGEMRDLLNDYAEKLYPNHFTHEADEARPSGDIESEIQAEINDMRQPSAATTQPLFTAIKLDVPCGEFQPALRLFLPIL